jgi:hypothetical protein
MIIQEIDYNIDLLQAILWQYNDAEKLQLLLTQKKDWYDNNYDKFWQDWYNNVFNLDTANEFGLSVWATILNLPGLYIPNQAGIDRFGFGDNNLNFDRGTFSPSASGVSLSLSEYRLALKLRYFNLITRGAIPEINEFLDYAFRDFGKVYALDGLNMTMSYVFTFPISQRLLDILKALELMPRPAAVQLNYSVLTRESFGFGEVNLNFERGTFNA